MNNMLDDYDVKYIAYRGPEELTLSVCHDHNSRLSGRLVLSYEDPFTDLDAHVIGWRPNCDAGYAALLELARTFVFDHPEWIEIEPAMEKELSDGELWLRACGIRTDNTPRKAYRAMLRRVR